MPKGEETFAEMCDRLKKEKVPENRQVDFIPERRYFLIVSEGAKTEPVYFEYFKKRLPRDMLETIEIEPGGKETIRVVELAMAKRKRRQKSLKPPYDEVWAVFDKDDFPDEAFNGAISLAEQKGIEHGASTRHLSFGICCIIGIWIQRSSGINILRSFRKFLASSMKRIAPRLCSIFSSMAISGGRSDGRGNWRKCMRERPAPNPVHIQEFTCWWKDWRNI
jgi:hypothetical protein